jgi:DNA topoisomerase-3
MSPKKVMQVAEKLYSAGFISYPRTETTRYDPNGFDVRSILREHTSHPEWGRTASYLLRTKYAKSSRPPLRGHDAGDHPPITCLKAATREEVGGGAAWRVYEFVARNFLGSLSDELKYTRRVAELRLGADKKHKFEVEKVHVESLGFGGACRWVLHDIGAEQKEEGSGKESNVLKEGMRLPINDARSELCATRPPRFLQEHELIELLDENRIG